MGLKQRKKTHRFSDEEPLADIRGTTKLTLVKLKYLTPIKTVNIGHHCIKKVRPEKKITKVYTCD